ncbi:MAG: T9SS type A sorting domain-containing protein, partial [Bacteroidota bacterium]
TIVDLDDEESPAYLTPIVTDPLSDNPLINAGTTGSLVPTSDINGNPRGETPEIGAIELDFSLTVVRDIEESGLDMSFFPNPTADVLNIETTDASIQSYRVILTDANGRVLRSNRFNGTVNQINFTTLPTGVYNLQLEVNGSVYSKQIVKQ